MTRAPHYCRRRSTPAPPQAFESWMPWEANPLYALLHESIYASGAPRRIDAEATENRERIER
jgi:hypothetical protein